MPSADLESVYAAVLLEMVSACEQAEALTERLAEIASADELVEALEAGGGGIADGLETLRSISEAHPFDDGETQSDTMAGIASDAQARIFEGDFADDLAKDAAIIAQYLQMVHFALAGYRALASIAQQLGHADEADRLQTCYEDSEDGLDEMARLLDGTVLGQTA